MENEKKNASPEGGSRPHKKHHHRRRGYFIEPPKADGSTPQPTGSAPTPEAPKPKAPESGEPRRDGQKSSSRHRNRRGKKRGSGTPNQNQNNQLKQNGQTTENAGKNASPNPQKNDTEKPATGDSRPGDRGGKNRPKQHQNNHNRKPVSDRLIVTETKPVAPATNESSEWEYEEVSFSAPEERENTEEAVAEEPVAMVEVVGVRFKNSGKTYYFAPLKYPVKRGDFVIVETARGPEYGEVTMGNVMVKESDTVPPLRPIVRIATPTDRQHHETNKQLEADAFRVCNEKIAAHGLDMKLIDAQYTFDNSKLLFYFTSAGRVDFRELVKDLASVFRTRIELRQIGIRDEAKLMGGMGMCGRPLCCTLFLSDFGQVSIKMAKEQNLSLNSAKISGICGRLMCCLRYEHEAYEYEIKRTPPVDSLVRTADGNGIVTEISPLRGTIKVRLLSTPDTPPKVYKREDVVMLQKKQKDAPKN